MNTNDIVRRVKKVVFQVLAVDETMTDDARFIEDLGVGSLDTVELVMAFEEEFDCTIPDVAVEELLTVKDVIRFMEERAQ
jgi:acyl carrier protein